MVDKEKIAKYILELNNYLKHLEELQKYKNVKNERGRFEE